MNSNEKRWIVLLVAVLLIAVILIVVLVNANKGKENDNRNEAQEKVQTNEEKYVEETTDGLKVNISEDFKKTRMYGNLEISNITYTYADGQSLLLADVTNKGTTTHEVEIVKLTILGENGEVMTDAQPAIGKIEPGETIQLNASVWGDLANAKDFKIEPVG